MELTERQKEAYDWAKKQNYPSVAAQYAKVLAELVDELQFKCNLWADTYGTLGAVPQAQLTVLPLNRLDPWESPDGRVQPFHPYTQEALAKLAEDIKKNGVIKPIRVRSMPNGRFQIVDGHNRVAASKLAGLTTIPAIIRISPSTSSLESLKKEVRCDGTP